MKPTWTLPRHHMWELGIDLDWTNYVPDAWRIRIGYITVYVFREAGETRDAVLDRALVCVQYLREQKGMGLRNFDHTALYGEVIDGIHRFNRTKFQRVYGKHVFVDHAEYLCRAYLYGRNYVETDEIAAWRKDAADNVHRVGYPVLCKPDQSLAEHTFSDTAALRRAQVDALLTIASPVNTACPEMRKEALLQVDAMCGQQEAA
ncbi:hypothetical protein EOS_03400 [Caballeronia mineralivorans PML1(12)]|uniref:Uncharacterized protein n=1 Tax=Caballeronia mineralivorans PML1(12) TaxID=908627 RepID=A0A0J1G623_9BURK|nr:hypothetical protein [Caballeronia mineralivorans]KLU27668.1 hypothetical protein EOS_03400 [Caballeronia mineralivorans PML1(12)]